MGLFQRSKLNNKEQVPVWFMRQAGRYHDHYQNIRKDHDFMTMCKTPALAAEITMGPIQDFDFDAAIIFSDLLFPLEYLGLGLTYAPGPKLGQHLTDASQLKPQGNASEYFNFQGEAIRELKKQLPKDKTTLGFVGAPFTLFTYAVQGSHQGNMVPTKKELYSGLYQDFWAALKEPLLEEIRVQAKAGSDAICLFDTAVGELPFQDYERFMLPCLNEIATRFKEEFPDKKMVYYSRNTHMPYLQALKGIPFDVLGVDWRIHLPTALKELSSDFYVQGNFDPAWLHLSWENLEANLKALWKSLDGCPHDRWVCGLGHGVMIETPQENVRKSVQFIHENFVY